MKHGALFMKKDFVTYRELSCGNIQIDE
uniref:Uncharacterized protein n=1 Tax=Anguilla anguilla TaxID=7936 RepID=A0A0E9SYF9_ANGAN